MTPSAAAKISDGGAHTALRRLEGVQAKLTAGRICEQLENMNVENLIKVGRAVAHQLSMYASSGAISDALDEIDRESIAEDRALFGECVA